MDQFWQRELGSAGFQTCCIADFQIGSSSKHPASAGLETRDTADSEVCATGKRKRVRHERENTGALMSDALAMLAREGGVCRGSQCAL
jgi:hypothetical protein